MSYTEAERVATLPESVGATDHVEIELLHRSERLAGYLVGMAQKGRLSLGMLVRSWEAWTTLRQAVDKMLAVPDAAAGSQGDLLYTWDRDEHHFEMEIFPDAPTEFFYRNAVSGELWEDGMNAGDPVPDGVVSKLRLFCM